MVVLVLLWAVLDLNLLLKLEKEWHSWICRLDKLRWVFGFVFLLNLSLPDCKLISPFCQWQHLNSEHKRQRTFHLDELFQYRRGYCKLHLPFHDIVRWSRAKIVTCLRPELSRNMPTVSQHSLAALKHATTIIGRFELTALMFHR